MEEISQAKFGRYIKKVRESKNITREELAEKLNISQDAVAKWENGKRYPDFERLYTLASVLGITVQDIYDNSLKKDFKNIKLICSLLLIFLIGGAFIISCVVVINKGGITRNGIIESETETETTEISTTDISTTEVSSEEDIPEEYKSVMKRAKYLSERYHLSKNGLYNSLKSPDDSFFDIYTDEEIVYAVDNLEVDYKKNALKYVKYEYEITSIYSKEELYSIAILAGFTNEEARYVLEEWDYDKYPLAQYPVNNME